MSVYPNLAVEAVVAIHTKTGGQVFHQTSTDASSFEGVVSGRFGYFRVLIASSAPGALLIKSIFPLLRQVNTNTQLVNSLAQQISQIGRLALQNEANGLVGIAAGHTGLSSTPDRVSVIVSTYEAVVMLTDNLWWKLTELCVPSDFGAGNLAQTSSPLLVVPAQSSPSSVPRKSSTPPVATFAPVAPVATVAPVAGPLTVVQIDDIQVVNSGVAQGSLGQVHLARVNGQSEDILVKQIQPASPFSEHQIAMIKAELEAAHAVRHPNLCPNFGICLDPLCILLPLRQNTLTQVLEVNKVNPLKLTEVVNILHQLVDGVAALHAAGIIHGRIKPSNVLIDNNQRMQLSDYGLLQTRKLTIGAKMPAGPNAIYSAPEVFMGKAPVAGTDVFPLGIILYQLALPKVDVVPPVVAERLSFAGAPSPKLEPLIRACLDRNAAKRTSVADFKSMLSTL